MTSNMPNMHLTVRDLCETYRHSPRRPLQNLPSFPAEAGIHRKTQLERVTVYAIYRRFAEFCKGLPQKRESIGKRNLRERPSARVIAVLLSFAKPPVNVTCIEGYSF